MTGTLNSATKQLAWTIGYLLHTGQTYYNIHTNLDTTKQTLATDELTINDYKSHLDGYGLAHSTDHNIYDHPIILPPARNLADGQKQIITTLGSMITTKPQPWMQLRANAAAVYHYLQSRGVLYGLEHHHPAWNMDTFSGRTATTGLNLQGLSDGEPLANINGDNIFLHFDWVTADFRMASLMSKDELLLQSFDHSDPYQHMADKLNENPTASQEPCTRDECKLKMLRGLYSLDHSAGPMLFYTQLGNWMAAMAAEIGATGKMCSILGRPFQVEGERTIRSVFNAAIQGSVAHAMQATIAAVASLYPDNILAEVHDSLIMTCNSATLAQTIIADVVRIMTRPLIGLLPDDYTFPVWVSIGRQYRKWVKFKRYDN